MTPRSGDNGIGSPEDEVPFAFERFFRSSRSQERAVRGGGLGPTVTRSIVERHGGEISVRSWPGAGTVVTCLLPAPADQIGTPAELPADRPTAALPDRPAEVASGPADARGSSD